MQRLNVLRPSAQWRLEGRACQPPVARSSRESGLPSGCRPLKDSSSSPSAFLGSSLTCLATALKVSRPHSRFRVLAAAAVTTSVETITATFVVPETPLGYGSAFKVVGAQKALGAWNLDKAPALHWTDGDTWVGDVQLLPGACEFKIVKVMGDGSVEWEQGSNRHIAASLGKPVEVTCQFGRSNSTVVRSSGAAGAATSTMTAAPVPATFSTLAYNNAVVAPPSSAFDSRSPSSPPPSSSSPPSPSPALDFQTRLAEARRRVGAKLGREEEEASAGDLEDTQRKVSSLLERQDMLQSKMTQLQEIVEASDGKARAIQQEIKAASAAVTTLLEKRSRLQAKMQKLQELVEGSEEIQAALTTAESVGEPANHTALTLLSSQYRTPSSGLSSGNSPAAGEPIRVSSSVLAAAATSEGQAADPVLSGRVPAWRKYLDSSRHRYQYLSAAGQSS